tara:strand:+ start:214 stop:477 length:264 start_codon:yes stop_codon:yes gene_type:complete
MYKIINFLMFLLVILFTYFVYNYYSSNKNINTKNYNRLNVDQILKEKIINLPHLKSDTDNVIEFNNSLENETNIKKNRNFWDLLKNK